MESATVWLGLSGLVVIAVLMAKSFKVSSDTKHLPFWIHAAGSLHSIWPRGLTASMVLPCIPAGESASVP